MSLSLLNAPTQPDIIALGALPYGPDGPPRVLGRQGPENGPILVCVAGLHGNEPMGVIGLARALSRLSALEGELRGRVVGLVGNRKALMADRRFIDHDLNRAWFADRIEALREVRGPLEHEERELVELDHELEPLLSGTGPVYLLDLHTTSGPGPAFSVVEDTLANRKFGLSFPVPMVLGFEEEVGGTMSNYLGDRGVIGIGFEAGQHREPAAAERVDAAVWIALEASGVLGAGSAEATVSRRRLEADTAELPPIVEVRYRHAISNSDRFRMNPGHRTFEAVNRGQSLGRDRSGEVTSPAEGLLLMPLYQELGDDGFFVVRQVKRGWLTLSAVMRRYRLERLLHWLPGVRKHPERAGAFIVNRRIARFLTLQLFHLLGFRRVGPVGRYVVLHRRPHDEGA